MKRRSVTKLLKAYALAGHAVHVGKGEFLLCPDESPESIAETFPGCQIWKWTDIAWLPYSSKPAFNNFTCTIGKDVNGYFFKLTIEGDGQTYHGYESDSKSADGRHFYSEPLDSFDVCMREIKKILQHKK